MFDFLVDNASEDGILVAQVNQTTGSIATAALFLLPINATEK